MDFLRNPQAVALTIECSIHVSTFPATICQLWIVNYCNKKFIKTLLKCTVASFPFDKMIVPWVCGGGVILTKGQLATTHYDCSIAPKILFCLPLTFISNIRCKVFPTRINLRKLKKKKTEKIHVKMSHVICKHMLLL